MQNIHAASVYQCKDAGGKVSFQEIPCTSSENQSILKQAGPAKPSRKEEAGAEKQSDSDISEYAACRQMGSKLFDASLPREQQHPQGAYNMCKKNLAPPMNRNSTCLDNCVWEWVVEYKKTYIDKK